MIRKLFSAVTGKRQTDRWAQEYRELIRQEASIGGSLFGPIAKDGRREFFCLDPKTWIWHEEWVDQNGQHQAITTRYDIRADGIFKAQDGQPYHRLAGTEAKHFYQATHLYSQRVKTELYGVPA